VIRADVVWAICSPENQARWRARAMRLAVRYATYWDTTPETIAALMPAEPQNRQVLLAALTEALDQLATRPLSGTTAADIWELVEQRATVAPVAVRPEVLATLVECAEHDVEPARFAATAIAAGVDPLVAGHLAAMVVGVLAGHLDLVRHLAATADKLDPPAADERTAS
jgi:hypothetical protein